MGLALAKALKSRGARVTLVAGPGVDKTQGFNCHSVVSAREMLSQVRRRFARCDVFISVAAVADYRPMAYSRRKMEKNNSRMTVELVPNPDILAEMGERKKNQMVVGFSLQDSMQNLSKARKKMRAKRCDIIVLNAVDSMDSASIQAKLIFSNGAVRNLGKISKEGCALKICQAILEKTNS